MEMRTLMKKTVSLMLSLAIIGSICTGGSAVTAQAEEQENPASIQEYYQIDEIIYFNVGSDQFSQDPEQYLYDLMTTKSSYLSGKSGSSRSMEDLWALTAVGISHDQNYYHWTNGTNLMEEVARQTPGSNGVASISRRLHVRDGGYDLYQNWPFTAKRYDMVYQPSLKNAEQWVLQRYLSDFNNTTLDQSKITQYNNIQKEYGFYKSDEAAKSGHVLVQMVDLYDSLGEDLPMATAKGYGRCAAVYFTDFEIVALLPEDVSKNYVSVVTRDTTTNGRQVASNVRNNTPATVSASQSIKHSNTATATSTVNGSQSYSFSESVKVGVGYKILDALKGSMEIGFTAGQTVSEGWSEAKGKSENDEYTESLSITLPPYTNVMLTQKNALTERVTSYNCPVGIKYKATVVLYTMGINLTPVGYSFGNDTREDIDKWAVRLPEKSNPQGLDWSNINSVADTIQDAVKTLAKRVPISPTGARFTERVETVEGEVSGIMPIYPLTSIKLSAPDISFISSGDVGYGAYSYLTANMKVGDFSYTDYITLSGYNDKGGAFYGFRKGAGYWIIVDENGQEMTADAAPITLVKDPVSGRTRYTAVKPGKCYLKYCIKDDAYMTAEGASKDPVEYITNDQIKSTAVLEVIVTSEEFDNGSVTVEGHYEGWVGDDPDILEGDDKLIVSVLDASGMELEKAYTWEQKELKSKGILVEGNQVSFTKPGKFHVRAVCGDIKSEWMEITAKTRTYDVTYKPLNDTDDFVVTVNKGDVLETPETPVSPTCKTFTGWYTDEACTQEYDFSEPVTAAFTLYAGWADAHSLTFVPAADAGCEEDGNISYYTCEVCSRLFADADGSTQLKEDDVVVKAFGHEWGDWTVTKEATEDEEGERQRVCAHDPSHTDKRVIPRLDHEHTLEMTPAKEARCLEDGNIAYYTCSGCGLMYLDPEGTTEIQEQDTVVKAPGHDWGDWTVIKAATETATGEEKRVCSRDDSHFEVREIPKLPHQHTLEKTEQKAASCHEDGNIAYYTCSICEKIFEDEKAENEIQAADTVIAAKHEGPLMTRPAAVEATCTKAGNTATVYCTACHEIVEQGAIVPAKGHQHTYILYKKDATCTQNGYTGDTWCMDCGEMISEGKTVPAAHKWDEGTVTKPATETEDGSRTFTCTVCGETKEETIPASGPAPKQDDASVTPETDIWGNHIVTEEKMEQKVLDRTNDADLPEASFSLLQLKQKAVTKNSITVSWKPVKGTESYTVYGSKCGNRNRFRKLADVKGTSYKYTKLKKGTYYKIMVVANGGGKANAVSRVVHIATAGGKVGNHKSVVITSKKKVTLKKGKTSSIKARAVQKSLPVKKHSSLAFESGNPKVATVSKKGKIKAVKKGTCYIYISAQNGVSARVKVTVK